MPNRPDGGRIKKNNIWGKLLCFVQSVINSTMASDGLSGILTTRNNRSKDRVQDTAAAKPYMGFDYSVVLKIGFVVIEISLCCWISPEERCLILRVRGTERVPRVEGGQHGIFLHSALNIQQPTPHQLLHTTALYLNVFQLRFDSE
jgi:hypothetical protein